jgi:hypothetical protein
VAMAVVFLFFVCCLDLGDFGGLGNGRNRWGLGSCGYIVALLLEDAEVVVHIGLHKRSLGWCD